MESDELTFEQPQNDTDLMQLEYSTRPIVHRVASSQQASSCGVKSVKMQLDICNLAASSRNNLRRACIKPVDNLQKTCCHQAGATCAFLTVHVC